MKTTIRNIVILASALLAACSPNANMTTVLNSNGSCDRVLVATVNEKFIQGDTTEHPFIMDLNGWDIKWKFKGEKIRNDWPVKDWKKDPLDSAATITAIAHKHYNSVKQMAEEFRIKPSNAWSDIRIKPMLEERFRFFYTYYDYKESFSKLPITQVIPVSRYLSAEEAGYWLTGKPDILKGMNGVEAVDVLNNIEKRAGKWLIHNLFEMQYSELLKHLELIANHPAKATMDTQKDSVFALYFSEYTSEQAKYDLMPILDKAFKTQAFGNFAKAGNDSLVAQINEPETYKHLSDYFSVIIDYKLVMPGDIITSDGILSQDTLSWRIDAYRLLNGDYTMEASSKKTNLWAFFVVAFLVLGTLVLFFVKRK